MSKMKVKVKKVFDVFCQCPNCGCSYRVVTKFPKLVRYKRACRACRKLKNNN